MPTPAIRDEGRWTVLMGRSLLDLGPQFRGSLGFVVPDPASHSEARRCFQQRAAPIFAVVIRPPLLVFLTPCVQRMSTARQFAPGQSGTCPGAQLRLVRRDGQLPVTRREWYPP